MSNHYAAGAHNRYGPTAARPERVGDLVKQSASRTIDVHSHIFVPEAEEFVEPHLDSSKLPINRFVESLSARINDDQGTDRHAQMTDIDVRLREMDAMGVDIHLAAAAPFQSYYSIDPEIARAAHRMTNEGIASFVAKRPDRFAGLGVVTLQEPEAAIIELEDVMSSFGLKGVLLRTNVNGEELASERFEPFFARAEAESVCRNTT